MADILAGNLLLPGDEIEAWVEVDDGRVTAFGEGPPDAGDTPAAEGWITPRPVNAHTHVADAFLRGARGMPTSIPELVGPGGWKHRQLAMARRGRAGGGVIRYAKEMAERGTTHFIDFRENGLSGARFLADLRDGAPWMQAEMLEPPPVEPIIFGRPAMHNFDPEEAEELFEIVDGIGLSGIRDFPERDEFNAWAEICADAGKPWAVHVSEDRHDPIDDVIHLGPAFVVHMAHGLGTDFQKLSDAGIPIVACPRSNAFFGNKTPIRAMLEAGCHVAIGTDNGMMQDGDLIKELAQLRQWEPGIPVPQLLEMLTFGGRALIGDMESWPPQVGDPAPACLPDVPAYVMA